MICNSDLAWGSVARTLHWLMALLILAMFILGWVAVSYPMSPTKLDLFIWHKSIGLSLLGLCVIRLAWRMVNPIPQMPDGTSQRERVAARAVHGTLYVLMLLMPASGYVINSAANFPFRFFGWYRVPNVIPPDEELQNLAEVVHLALFWVFFLVVVLHITAALHHHVVKKDTVLTRMITDRK